MLNINKIILTKDGIELGFIREFYFRASYDNLVVYAETINTAGIRANYIVNTIEPGEMLKIDLKEIDFTQSISEPEKIVDIRDFKKKK